MLLGDLLRDPTFFTNLHRFIVEITLLILVLIGAYKLIRTEWPSDKRDGTNEHGPPRASS